MSDSYKPLLKGIIAALLADGTISGIVGARVYSDVPQNDTFPYVIVSIQSGPFDTKTSVGMTHTVQVSCFSREDSPSQAGDLCAAVYSALNRNEGGITLDSGNLTRLNFSGVGFVGKEPDGVTWQGTRQFEAIVN